jgi:4-amino-4-deoxy-L-arabinose transferase-like glycosyltransferase
MNDQFTKFCWLLAIAALSFLPALGHYYVGEEAIFPISSLEMWQHGVWLKQYMYGQDMQHNPLFNWLIMPAAALAGWSHVLIVTRILTIAATLATAATLAWLSNRLFQDRTYSAFAALAYLSMADVLLYHGWLGYVDPLFALFIFSAVATLWVAALEQRISLLALAGLLITLAFLSKAFTAYVFYGTALFVLLFEPRLRSFLLSGRALPFHAVVFAAPMLWLALIPHGSAQGGRMFAEILQKLSLTDLRAYIVRLFSYPLEILLWLSPISALALYSLIRKRSAPDEGGARLHFRLAAWMVLLQFAPYWLVPQGGMRYLIPIYPLFALVASRLVWQSGMPARVTAQRWFVAALALNIVVAVVAFPYYQSHYRGKNYHDTAIDILQIAQDRPLYVTDVSAAGLSVTGYIDQRIYPHPALQWPPAQWSSGYVIAHTADATLGTIYKKYRLGGDELFLLCRGRACVRSSPL